MLVKHLLVQRSWGRMEKYIGKTIFKIIWDSTKKETQFLKSIKAIKTVKGLSELQKKKCTMIKGEKLFGKWEGIKLRKPITFIIWKKKIDKNLTMNGNKLIQIWSFCKDMKTTLKTWEIEGIWGLVISRVDQSSASGSYLIQNIVVSIELIRFYFISLFPFYKIYYSCCWVLWKRGLLLYIE